MQFPLGHELQLLQAPVEHVLHDRQPPTRLAQPVLPVIKNAIEAIHNRRFIVGSFRNRQQSSSRDWRDNDSCRIGFVFGSDWPTASYSRLQAAVFELPRMASSDLTAKSMIAGDSAKPALVTHDFGQLEGWRKTNTWITWHNPHHRTL